MEMGAGHRGLEPTIGWTFPGIGRGDSTKWII